MKTYTTISGDMWDSVAHTILGNVNYTGQLMMMNTRYLDYFILPAGVVLNLPEEVRQTPNELLPPWKR